jgi:hypothetical protein
MPLRFSEPEKVFIAGNFSIGFNFSPDALYVTITDDNPHFREAQVRGKWEKQITPRHGKRRRACLFGKEFLCNIESTGTLLANVLCPAEPKPEPCPPDPCAPVTQVDNSGQSTLRNRQQYSEVYTEENYTEPDESSDIDTPVGTFTPVDIEIWGYGLLGGIDRTRFHSVMYRFAIPQANFTGLYNRLEIYLKDDNGIPVRLLSTSIEKVDLIADEEDPLTQSKVDQMIIHSIESKADKAEIDRLNNRIDQLEQFVRDYQDSKSQPDTTHKPIIKGAKSQH